MIKIVPKKDNVIVILEWSQSNGECYECFLPAAFAIGMPSDNIVDDSDKRCTICAANAAADGESIYRILNGKFCKEF